MTARTRIRLGDEDLFGNEAAEDERDDVFEAYAYPRPELEAFCDPNRPMRIVRAYKGSGKSALLRIAKSRLQTGQNTLAIDSTGPALAPDLSDGDYPKWVRAWKTGIMDLVANEVGARINMAWTDDTISLVELSEKNGFRSRNIVSAIIDRLTHKQMPLDRTRLPAVSSQQTIARWSANGPDVWLFIDDIDRNFDGTRRDELRTASFFDACRALFRDIPSLRFRIAIRPNTWILLKRGFEGMSHVEQYAFDLIWKENDILALLSQRIHGYLARNTMSELLPDRSFDAPERMEALLNLVFENPVRWGGKERPIHIPLDSLSLHRPRWLIELCRVSAAHATAFTRSRIMLKDDVFRQLDAFGQRRLDDTVAEFAIQCPQIAEVLDGFRGQAESFVTSDLLTTIQNRVVNHVPVRFAGEPSTAKHRDVAHFLFKIGFIFARRDYSDGTYEHIGFEAQPTLLTSRSDTDSGYSWEIPSTFRQALDLRTAEGIQRPTVQRGTRDKPRRRVVP